MFVLGKKSLANLDHVHADLQMIVREAITITKQDFSVHEGLRTQDRQKMLFDQGRSKIDGFSKKGRHMLGADGFGHAVDLVPYCDGELCWEWELIFPVCDAIKMTAKRHSIPIRWGGTWQNVIEDRFDAMNARGMYAHNPSWDGAHYELPVSIAYPG